MLFQKSAVSRGDVPDDTLKRAQLRQRVRKTGTGAVCLLVAVAGAGGLISVWQSAARAKDAARRAEARRNGIVADRQKTDERGVPLLTGPLVEGGPTWGKSQWADIEWLENGWFLFGRDGAWETDPHTRSYVLIRFQNKSGRMLYNVQAPIELYTDEGYLRTDVCTFGDTEDGRMRRKTCGPVPANVTTFRVQGFQGSWTPVKATASPGTASATGSKK